MKRCRVKVCAIGLDERMNFGIDSHLIEHRQFPQRSIKLTSQNRFEIDHLFRIVIELHTQRIRCLYLKGSDTVNRV